MEVTEYRNLKIIKNLLNKYLLILDNLPKILENQILIINDSALTPHQISHEQTNIFEHAKHASSNKLTLFPLMQL